MRIMLPEKDPSAGEKSLPDGFTGSFQLPRQALRKSYERKFMAENRLSRMSRKELLEMLLEQSRLLDSREKEIERLNALLEDRRVTAEKAGSIAEAALQLSGIFEAAQRAADIYLESIGAAGTEKKDG